MKLPTLLQTGAMLHSRRDCKINVALAWKAIKGSSIPLSCSQKSQRDMDHPRHSDSGETAGSAIENYKSSKRKSQRSHVVERMEVQASMAKAGKNPPPQREGGAAEAPFHDGDSKNSFATGSHRKADCFHSSPRAELGSRLALS